MFSRLLLASAFLLTAPLAHAVEPPIVVQAQPLSRIQADVRTLVKAYAGPEGELALKSLDDGIKAALGEKGFEGIDLNRHLAAYGTFAENPEKSTLVLVLPTSGDKEFLDLLERIKLKATAVDGKKGLYQLEPIPPAGDLPVPAYLRLVEGTAYISVNDPKGALLDPAKLLAAKSLVKLEDQALVTVRANPTLLPAKLIKQPFEFYEKARKGEGPGMFGMGAPELSLVSLVYSPFLVLQHHLDALLTEAQEVALRLSLPSAEIAVELTVTPKPGTKLAATIAALKPHTNRFAGLLPKSPAMAVALTLPFSVPEAREGAIDLLDLMDKGNNDAPSPIQPVLAELIKGLKRTVKASDLDFAGAMTEVDEKGRVHAFGAITFDDPSGIEKALSEMVKTLPEDAKKDITFDAAKAGAVSLHTVKLRLDEEMRKIFITNEAEPLLCVAFTPKAIFAAMGSNPIPVVRAALAVTAGPAKQLDIQMNPNRLHKVVAATGEEAGKRFEQILGTEDRTKSILSVAAEGGAAFQLRFTLNPVFMPRGRRTDIPASPAAP